MGGAKATAPLAGRPLVAWPLAALAAAGLEAVVVAKRTTALPPLEVPVWHEPDAPVHPLAGLVAALERAGRPVVAVGCDMPFLAPGLLAALAAGVPPGGGPGEADRSARVAGGAEADRGVPVAGGGEALGRALVIAPRVAGRLAPFPARYERAALPALRVALAREAPMRATLAALAPAVLDEDVLRAWGEPARLVASVNDAAELAAAEAALR